MHLVIYFCGTSSPGKGFLPQYRSYVQPGSGFEKSRVEEIVVEGCDSPQVCNDKFFPNLKSFANRFVNTLFGQVGEERLEILPSKPNPGVTRQDILHSIGVGLDRSSALRDLKGRSIESITLCGYSRGAVTCFEVARELHKIAPDIPVDIVANQPVPGNCYQGPGTNANSIADCSDLTNVKNVSVILGAYTGAMTEFDLHVERQLPQDLERYKKSYIVVNNRGSCVLYYVDQNGKCQPEKNYEEERLHNTLKRCGIISTVKDIDVFAYGKHIISGYDVACFIDKENYRAEAAREVTSKMHRGFFSQILPKLPRGAEHKQEHIIIPRESHEDVRPNAPDGNEHMHMKVAEFLHRRNTQSHILVSDENLQKKINEARKIYAETVGLPVYYPQVAQLQRFFGLSEHDVYQYVDPLHPAPNLRKGMTLREGETLIQWWNTKDKQASRFSTQPTKDLVSTIKETKLDNVDALIKLFNQADEWLVAKENSSTSRYYQVESLRNIIYYHLIDQHNVPKEQLDALNRITLHKTHYFHMRWMAESAAASWFKTEATRHLDKAFAKHASSTHTEADDKELLSALNVWFQAKESRHGSRYDLAVKIYEDLKQVIDNGYKWQEDQSHRYQLSLRGGRRGGFANT